MSILAKTKNNLSILNVFEKNTNYKDEINSFISKYTDELLTLKNVAGISITLMEKLAPNWSVIEEVGFLKEKGLADGKEEDYTDLVSRVEDYNNLSEENKLFLIEFINVHRNAVDVAYKFKFKTFKKIIEMLNVNGFIYNIDLDYLKETNVFDMEEEEMNEFLNGLQSIFKKYNKTLFYNEILFNIKKESMPYALLVVNNKKFNTESNHLLLKAMSIGEMLNSLNFENFDEENFYDKLHFILEKYPVELTNKYISNFFLPIFKKDKTINDLNKDVLDLFEYFKTMDQYHSLIANTFKKKKFMKTLLTYIQQDEMIETKNLNTTFKMLNDLNKTLNLNTLNIEDLDKLFGIYSNFNYYTNSSSYYDAIELIEEYKESLNPNELLFYVLHYKNSLLNEFTFKNLINLKTDTRLSIYKLLNSISLKGILFKNELFVKGFKDKLKSYKNPINMIHFYKEYEEKNSSLNKTNAFIHMILKETPLNHYLTDDMTDADITFIIENMNNLDSNFTLEENKLNFIRTNEKFLDYLKEMNISKEFVERNMESFLNFINNGNVETTKKYLKSVRSSKQIENIGLIVKAEIAGKLSEIKYNAEDLRREIGFNITDEMINQWKNEIVKKGRYTVRESSDFKTLFEMGENPTRSCMSYADGMYNYCLLSIYDGNKKLVTVYDGDKLVGRAILRLTKINKNGNQDTVSTLGFRDVETDEMKLSSHDESGDKIVLFLERLYTSYTGNQRIEIEKLMFDLLKEKSKEMNLDVYASGSYELINNKSNNVITHESVSTKMFISYSKNGEQYLDSLGGSSTNSKGGTFYKANLNKIIFK